MGHGPCLCHSAPLRVPHSEVPGRLTRPRLLVSGSHAGEGLSPLALPGAWDPGESLQELPRSYADFGLSGDESSNSSFEGFPDSKASSEALLSAARVRVLSAAASRVMASTSRIHVIPFRHRSGFSSADASSSTSTQHCQPSPSGLCFSVLGRFLPTRSSVVVRRVPPHRRSLSGSSGSGSGFVHGHLRFRLGSLSSGQPSVRLVVSELFVFFDQLSGASYGAIRSPGFPSGFSGPFGVPFCRQHHRSLLSAEARVHPFCDAQYSSSVHPPVWRASPGPSGSPVYPGNPQCSCRFCESPVSGPRVGVDLVSSGLPGASPSLASDDRPVCDGNDGPSSSVLRSDIRPSVSGHGRHDAVVGWPSSLSLPTLRPSASCAVEGQVVQGSGAHGGGSVLASAPLVSGPSGASGGCSGFPPTAEGSTQTAALPSLSPEPPRASSDCLSYIECSAHAFGFSASVARQLARYGRCSTRVNYQAKWEVFRSWCYHHGHSVSRLTVPKIASFLLYLRRSLSLSYSSIASYRSMLSGVFRFLLPKLSSHFVLHDLLHSFCLERPLLSSRVPPWDLSVVLFFEVLPFSLSLLSSGSHA